jgi:hypothetical protein
MAKKEHETVSARSRTSVAALCELTMHITDILQRGELDPRFAHKMARRLRDEADLDEVDPSVAPQAVAALRLAFEQLEGAVNHAQADGLITALVELREADKKKPKKKSRKCPASAPLQSACGPTRPDR